MPYLRLTFIAPILSAMLLVSGYAGVAEAQFPRQRTNRTFTPNRPTMPAELDYFRRDVGVLDPFNTFVRPRRELNQVLQQQQGELNMLQQQQMQQRQTQGGAIAPTGINARFFNYSHFYPGMGGRGR